MKKIYTSILLVTLVITSKSQTTSYSGFEDLPIQVDTFWNGNDLSGGFNSEYLRYDNVYDTAWGGSWKGFSYSSMRDTLTAGYTNQYSCIAGKGAGNSQNYGVGYVGGSYLPVIKELNSGATGVATYEGIWVNNSTYTYLSMKNGDSFAKKFGSKKNAGGTIDSTNGEDWFKLTIYGDNKSDSIDFYLADYRFSDSTNDYIIKDWTYVDISSLSATSNLEFALSSSDNGSFGMNTPSFFCIDSVSYTQSVSGLDEKETSVISVYPNPTRDWITVSLDGQIKSGRYKVYDIAGREVINKKIDSKSSLKIDLSNQNNGVYFIVLEVGDSKITERIIKQ